MTEWSIARIYQLIPESELDEIAAIGDSRDDHRWKLGDYAVKWVEQGLPAMWVYAAIAYKADCSMSAVRNYAYTARAFPHASPLREEYHFLRFSIFDWSRRHGDPDVVLKYAADTRAGIHEVMETFPPERGEIEEEPAVEENAKKWPSWSWPIMREIKGLPEARRKRAEMLLEHLRAVIENDEWKPEEV